MSKEFKLVIKQDKKQCTYVLKDEKWRFEAGVGVKDEEDKEDQNEITQKEQEVISDLQQEQNKRLQIHQELLHEIRQLTLKKTIRMIEFLKSCDDFENLKRSLCN
uniref:Uncharacterized protein n=1 Tax=Euplotes harpa TaxID=151035 RepID=A0A7S3J6C9_9SPIT|mmetsp:Transcript_22582/g.25947  ORF Transcript_22582/g.25947 Transcript_22582/m.25947 type:complete len:105 (+) Transcript_22582:47-361(+)|eukprot:CAMPEP_0168334868 /NCGR_PEP_ID=MMETSP0213-20121227/10555_1 /TAXON_ID=151035 /ORGANISM="Euplotes harpa, Strain FSP1.4" /LENGTH=104 /DNA_ID=CAMNT_0008339657 /DNA_START=42 /DNA_END=356 /DNA_ORIENTATION=-